MGFLSNWFVAHEVISGSTCRHLAVLYGLGKYLLEKNTNREKKNLLEIPFTSSLYHRKFDFFFKRE